MRIKYLGLAAACAMAVACGPRSEPGKESDTACGVPSAPADLRTSPGPGPSQAAIAWSAAGDNGGAPVHRYVVYRDGQPFARLGNTLAFADTGTNDPHAYQVAAINTCGAQGPLSDEITATPLPGVLVEAPVAEASAGQDKVHEYKVLDSSGKEIGTRQWRTITGLGNCCETYVSADASGHLYEYGGSTLFVSDDEGQSWKAVSNIAPTLGAEGAIVGAPGGDMLAVNWDPYIGDQVWAHKYVAATDTWYTARTPVHAPFHDRPWVAVVEGPFELEGQIIPYVSFVMSNYIHGDILMMSLDGLHYAVPNPRILASTSVPLSLSMPPDPDRDWLQSMRETSVYPLDNGYGLRDRSLLSECPHAVLTPDVMWMCPNWVDVVLVPEAGEVVRIDSKGAIHVTTARTGENLIEHRVSLDAGKTWKSVTARVPNRLLIEDWDVQVNAALDQAVIVVHASESTGDSGNDQDMLFRFTDLHGELALKEILLVGEGDHAFGSSLGSSGDRFDYTTVALLPSGRVALSFGDRRHVPPAVAVEMP